MVNRRKSRELALQVLYAYDMCGGQGSIDDLVAYAAGENGCDEGVGRYGRFLVDRALESMHEIDALIQRHTANWDLKRVAAVDRALLRLSVAELRYSPHVPFKVAINEAVEIAKRYGTRDSGRFVNGVIDSVYREIAHT
jgi:N utilization substance protein B